MIKHSYLLLLILISCTSQTEKADRIYFNAKIWTGDTSQPWASALAIRGNQLLFVGNEFESYKSGSTEMIDIGGKMIVPGLIDNHTHFLSGGYNLGGIDLRKAKSKQEFIQIVKEYCLQHADNRWILGGDWDHESWGGELPAKEWIDSVTGNHSVFVSRYDGHMAFANSKALQLAKVTDNTKSPNGGEIIRNKKGELTGVFKDEAMNIFFGVMPPPSEKELDEYLQTAARHAFSNGVTQVHDMGSYGGWADLTTYRRAQQNYQLDLRLYSFVPFNTWQRLDSFCKVNGKGNDMLRWGAVKGFVDGSLGSTTAWFYKSYLDAPNTTGFTVNDTNDIRKWIIGADKAGLQVAVHAIGDRANDFLLNVFLLAAKENGERDRRFRIEHAQHLTQEAIKRFAPERIIPSMQPYHAIDDGRWAFKRLDEQRLKETYAFKSLMNTKANLTFGSDWTVAPLSPLAGIYAAVTRRTLDDKNNKGWYPEQKLTVEEALRCYTYNNAYAGFQENKVGILKKNMLADFVVLSENLFDIAPEKIKEVAVMRTVINGKEVYKKRLRAYLLNSSFIGF